MPNFIIKCEEIKAGTDSGYCSAAARGKVRDGEEY